MVGGRKHRGRMVYLSSVADGQSGEKSLVVEVKRKEMTRVCHNS